MLRSLTTISHCTRVLTSRKQLRAEAEAWDALYARCDASPTSRAALVEQWIERFAPRRRFRAITVANSQGQLIAAVPFVEHRMLPGVQVGVLPRNYSSQSGDLLLDPECDRRWACEQLVAAFRQLPWPALWLRLVNLDSADWCLVRQIAAEQDMASLEHQTHEIGLTEFPPTWEANLAAMGGNHRKKMRKYERRAMELGGVGLRIERPTDPGKVADLMRMGFEVEDRSWKGANGSSVLRTPGLFDFFVKQAELLAQQGELQLSYLMHHERAIAFEYGFQGPSTYYSPKIGYDPAFGELSPGHLLTYWQHRDFYTRETLPRVDYSGPLTEAVARWATSSYREGHYMLSLRRIASLPSMTLFRLNRWRKLRRQRTTCGGTESQ